MKQILAPVSFALLMLSTPLQAEEGGSNLMERGAEMFWEGLRKEMAPSLKELEGLVATIGPSMQAFLQEMGPALAEIAQKVEDWSAYEAPEILPNGDIIIRKKQKLKPEPEVSTDPESGITDL
ncbi:hypothetical protein RSK20926_22374 [Roseobacter sp. SK209-2-6]|uniref:hypothetical protein n=1 Tax=Roseobacter sp. SK209-2-6 TaxID=388739 RepID=UPI0000F3F3D2|nr:hypothetical protein [Roseobacter sp. SK209-2-6]EBA16518.1 hypothetical protein RSK20926_22374 [Roseobacter sp. SK209-2-6]